MIALRNHEFRSAEHRRHIVLIRKYCCASTFYISLKLPCDNSFHPDFSLVERLASLTENDSIMNVKGTLYSICGEFDKDREYIDRSTADDDLISKIFKFGFIFNI